MTSRLDKLKGKSIEEVVHYYIKKVVNNIDITNDMSFMFQIKISFADFISIIVNLEDYYRVELTDDELIKIWTVKDLIDLFSKRVYKKIS